MFRLTTIFSVRFLTSGVKALPSKGPGALVDKNLDQDFGRTCSISSQRYFYEEETSSSRKTVVIDGRSKGRGAIGDSFGNMDSASMSKNEQASILRLGGAQILSPTSHAFIPNDSGYNSVYYSKTAPKESGLCASIVAALRKLRIYKLTELQGALVPLMLRGKHVFVHAETGTGKSFGIALAVANKIVRESISYRLHTVILTPTEELALQYDRWLKHFGGCASQICQPAIDSIPLETQLTKLHNIHPHVLVGTVSRIAEISESAPHIFGHKLRNTVDTIVLDEADLILNAEVMLKNVPMTGASFINRLYRCGVDDVPAQIVAASATVDGTTSQQINEWMRNDRAVRISTSFVKHTLPTTIDFYFVAGASHRILVNENLQIQLEKKQDNPEQKDIECDQFTDTYTNTTPPSLTPSEELFTLALQQSPVTLPLGGELLRVLSLIYKHHSVPKVVIFTSYETECVCAFLNSPAAVDYILSQSVGRLSRGISSSKEVWESSNVAVGDGEVRDKKDSRGYHHDNANMLRDYGILACALQHSKDPQNPDCQLRARQIVGKNKEIIIKNNTNISKLSDGRLMIGVGGYSLSRGMHIGNVSHVIILGEAPSSMQFVHCAGRTGRMGKNGEVFTIFPPTSGKLMQSVCQAVELPFKITKLSSIIELLDLEDFTQAESQYKKDARMIREDASNYRQEELKRIASTSLYKYTTGIEGTPAQYIKGVVGDCSSYSNNDEGSGADDTEGMDSAAESITTDTDSHNEAHIHDGVGLMTDVYHPIYSADSIHFSDSADAIFDIMNE